MSRLLVRVFRELGCSDRFTAVSPKCLGSAASAGEGCTSDFSPHGAPVLLFGPPSCGKSFLLFVAATLAAEEGAGPVIFLSREPLQKIPKGGRVLRDPLILKKIHFLYPSSMKELLHLFSSLHLASPFPSLILVDGLERYLHSTSTPQDGAHLSALMLDSASFARCGLLLSAIPSSEGTDGAFLSVERYFPKQCHLYCNSSTETESREFRISFTPLLEHWTLHTAQDGSLKIAPVANKTEKSADQT